MSQQLPLANSLFEHLAGFVKVPCVLFFLCVALGSSSLLKGDVIRAGVATRVYSVESGTEEFHYSGPVRASGYDVRYFQQSWHGIFLADAISEAQGRSDSDSLGAMSLSSSRASDLEATNHNPSTTFETRSRASFSEEIRIGTIQDNGDFIASSSISAINLNFHVHGNLIVGVDKAPGRLGGGWALAQAGFSVGTYRDQFVSLASDRWDLFLSESLLLPNAGRSGDDIDISRVVSARLELNGGYGNFFTDLVTIAGANDGFAIANFMNTISLASVTFDDGTTPESQGYTLRFGSGRISPNASVPEPSAFVLLGMAGSAAFLGRSNRRRLKANSRREHAQENAARQ